MPLAELLLSEFDDEVANTRRLLACVPEGKTAWQPHEKSMTMGRLATHVAELPGRVADVLTRDEWDPRPPGSTYQPRTLDSTAKILDVFDQGVREARSLLAATTDALLAKPWVMKRGGSVILESTKYAAYRRLFLNHTVHHRGQLGVYLRLSGVPIPGMYGPSADDLAKRS